MLAYFHICQDHGQRVGQQETEQRADQRQQDGKAQCLGMFRRRDGRDVFQCEGAGLIRQSVVEDHAERNDDKDHRPECVGRREPFVLRCQLPPPPRLQIPVCS